MSALAGPICAVKQFITGKDDEDEDEDEEELFDADQLVSLVNEDEGFFPDGEELANLIGNKVGL